MKMNRVWAMPNKWTFQIKPIMKLLNKYIGDSTGWVDPFAGKNSPAETTNDLKPEMPTDYHLPALEFVEIISQANGVIFDPPYSLRQVKECYNQIGQEMHYTDTLDASFGAVKNIIAPKIIAGGYAICCGWSSNGFGKGRGFELVEILLVAHDGHHHDTIVTVERKTNSTLDMFE